MAKYGYIGNNPDNTPVIIARQVYNPTGVQTNFTFNAGYTPGYLDVYLNGVKLLNVSDYSATDGSVVGITSAAQNGDSVEIVAYKAFTIGQSILGISSAGTSVRSTGVNVLNFVGAAVTDVGGNQLDISITPGITTADVSTSSLVVVGISTLGNVTAGVATANQFSGNITGTAATFTGNVTVGGTLTYDDVTNIDSIGLITARNGLQVTGGIATVTGQTNLANVSVSAASTFSGKINANSGVGFTGFLREGINIVSGKLSDNVTINVDHSMVHYFTTTETTTSIPNITSTAGINTDLSTGESFSINILTTAAAAGYSTGARIDAGATLPVLWNGGTDPSTGGSAGVDVYTFQVIKTADATFTILGNVSNFA